MSDTARPSSRGCDVVVGDFAWFSQTCGRPSTGRVTCKDAYCDDIHHEHNVCPEHGGPPAARGSSDA